MTGAKVRCKDCYWIEHASQVGICPYWSRYMDQDLLRNCKTFLDKKQTRLIEKEGPEKDQGNDPQMQKLKQTSPQDPQIKLGVMTPIKNFIEACPQCGSSKVIRHVKDTFQYDGWICIDCLHIIPDPSKVYQSNTLAQKGGPNAKGPFDVSSGNGGRPQICARP